MLKYTLIFSVLTSFFPLSITGITTKALQVNQNESSPIEMAKKLVFEQKRAEAMALLLKEMRLTKSTNLKSKAMNLLTIISESFYTDETFKNYQEGMNYYHLKQYEKAILSLRLAENNEKDNVKILFSIANIFFENQNYSEAKIIFKKILELNPTYLQHFEKIFKTFEIEKDYNGLDAFLHILYPYYTTNPELNLKMAETYTQLGLYKKSATLFKKFMHSKMFSNVCNYFIAKDYIDGKINHEKGLYYLGLFIKNEKNKNKESRHEELLSSAEDLLKKMKAHIHE